MPSIDTRKKRQDSQAIFLEYLIDWVGPSGKREFMMSDFRDYCGFSRNMVEDYVSAFDKIGLIRKSGIWKRMTKGKRSFGANHTTIELLDSPDDLRTKLKAIFDEENRTGNTIVRSVSDEKAATRRKGSLSAKAEVVASPIDVLHHPNKVAIAVSPDETVRAVVGEDAPSTITTALRSVRTPDEVAALVAAARQYNSRTTELNKAFEDFRTAAANAGATVDVDLGALVRLSKDPQLEAVSLVLPYIEQLERMVERLANENARLNKTVSDTQKLERENRSLSEQNKRLIATNMQLRSQTH